VFHSKDVLLPGSKLCALFESMLIETNVCYITYPGRKYYFISKQIILTIRSNVDTNKYIILHLFSRGNKRLEGSDLKLSWKQSRWPREA
jgi:hypothetical protein